MALFMDSRVLLVVLNRGLNFTISHRSKIVLLVGLSTEMVWNAIKGHLGMIQHSSPNTSRLADV